MIDLYYWPTPNGWKVTIMLEETGLDYQIIPVDIGAGDQFAPEFLKISPNNRMPALIDHDPLGGGAPISIFESGAMLEYLADKSGMFLPTDPQGRYKVLQWVHWQMANLGPMMGNANHFKNYAKKLVDDPDELTYGAQRFTREVDRLAGVMDAQLSANEYIAGDEYSIADMICWPWAMLKGRLIDESIWQEFPHLKRWVDLVAARPAVDKGWQIMLELRDQRHDEAETKRRQQLLFEQTNASVRAAREAAAQS